MTDRFSVTVEPDGERWHAYCPALLSAGAATWGYTRAEALRNIQDVVRMVVDSLIRELGMVHSFGCYGISRFSCAELPVGGDIG